MGLERVCEEELGGEGWRWGCGSGVPLPEKGSSEKAEERLLLKVHGDGTRGMCYS